MGALDTYDAKRDFAKTGEPQGERERSQMGALRFVIQKHDATRLHYDLRLEVDGVYKSWAVPKGPSMDPADKRLAVQTEDHPLAYGSFEGTIPEGEYGAGTVEIWDQGAFVPDGDASRALANGRLTFALEGARVSGTFHLVRTRAQGKQQQWLLMKSRDDAKVHAPVDHARKDERFVAPQLCKLVDHAPDGDRWIYEPKIDGYRVILSKRGDDARVYSRNGLDWSAKFPRVVDAVRALPVDTATLDGEVAVVDARGAARFEALQEALSNAGDTKDAVCFVFDVTALNGVDLRAEPLLQRKWTLDFVLVENRSSALGMLEWFDGAQVRGSDALARVLADGAEGVVAKQKDAPYRSGRGDTWLKIKSTQSDEYVVVGFTDSDSGPRRIGALALASQGREGETRGRLVYAGKVGTGFSAHEKRALFDTLHADVVGKPFCAGAPGGREVHWVKPKLVVTVEFGEVTKGGQLRHPRFRGVREDITAATFGASDAAPMHSALPEPDADVLVSARSNIVRGVTISNPDRDVAGGVTGGVTKLTVARYVDAIAPLLLPFVRGRPLSVVRCPQGVAGGAACFYQKHIGQGMRAPIGAIDVGDEEGAYVTVHDAAGLVALVQMGALELHPWGCAEDEPDVPDRITIDLDPADGLPWRRVCDAARLVRERLLADGLTPFVKLTGGKGLHVDVPLAHASTSRASLTNASWDSVKAYAKNVADAIAHDAPDAYTASLKKSARVGRVFVDYLRNGRGATAIAPYSMRARAGAPVALPVGWDDIDALDPRRVPITIANLTEHLARNRAWADWSAAAAPLPGSHTNAPVRRSRTARGSARAQVPATRRRDRA